MSLLRDVFTRHRGYVVVCRTGDFGALKFQSRHDETMHICILRRVIRECGCRTRARARGENPPWLYYGESGSRWSWETAEHHHRHLARNRTAIHPRYEYNTSEFYDSDRESSRERRELCTRSNVVPSWEKSSGRENYMEDCSRKYYLRLTK